MYKIRKNNVITLTRGDYLQFPVKLVTGEFPKQSIWELEENDVVYFGLMDPHQPFENALIKKAFTKKDEDKYGNLYVTLQPEDTIDLIPGTYYYAIKAIYTLGDEDEVRIDTIIQRTKFIIVE